MLVFSIFSLSLAGIKSDHSGIERGNNVQSARIYGYDEIKSDHSGIESWL